jgi:hypothetical protein
MMILQSGRPLMDGKTARGASSPENPALTMPLPLSTTNAEKETVLDIKERLTYVALDYESEMSEPDGCSTEDRDLWIPEIRKHCTNFGMK